MSFASILLRINLWTLWHLRVKFTLDLNYQWVFESVGEHILPETMDITSVLHLLLLRPLLVECSNLFPGKVVCWEDFFHNAT